MAMKRLIERVFPEIDRRMPLDRNPLVALPEWGHWLETPDLIAAMLTPGQLEVNLIAPFDFISTRFQPGFGMAAFASDKLIPYRSEPGGFDVVPQGSTYQSKETAGVCIILAYKQPIASRIMAEYTDEASIELIPGQIQPSAKGTRLAQALRACFIDADCIRDSLYLESLATLIMGHVIRQGASPGQLKRVPDCLTLKQIKAIVDYIQSHLDTELQLAQIASSVGISSYYLAHAFKSTTGVTPHQYVLHCRLARSQQLLRNTQMSIVEIAYEVGFGSQSHMTTVFRKILQTTPSRYRQLS